MLASLASSTAIETAFTGRVIIVIARLAVRRGATKVRVVANFQTLVTHLETIAIGAIVSLVSAVFARCERPPNGTVTSQVFGRRTVQTLETTFAFAWIVVAVTQLLLVAVRTERLDAAALQRVAALQTLAASLLLIAALLGVPETIAALALRRTAHFRRVSTLVARGANGTTVAIVV